MYDETFMYTVKVALLGIGVVFVSLWALSLLMSLIKRLFAGESEMGPRREPAAPPVASQEEKADSFGALPPWVIAGSVAFLIEEELEDSRSAVPWTGSRSGGYDPWLHGRRG